MNVDKMPTRYARGLVPAIQAVALASCIATDGEVPIIDADSRTDFGPSIEFEFSDDILAASRIREGRYLVEPLSLASGRTVSPRDHSIVSVHRLDGLPGERQFLIWEIYYCGRNFCPDFNIHGAVGLAELSNHETDAQKKRFRLALFNVPFLDEGPFSQQQEDQSLEFTRKIVAIGRRNDIVLLPRGRTANSDVRFIEGPDLKNLRSFYSELLMDGQICILVDERHCEAVTFESPDE
jgi:hypothetical protein